MIVTLESVNFRDHSVDRVYQLCRMEGFVTVCVDRGVGPGSVKEPAVFYSTVPCASAVAARSRSMPGYDMPRCVISLSLPLIRTLLDRYSPPQ